jgi:hypothetical protein
LDSNECCSKKKKLDPPTHELALKFEIGTPDLGSSKLKCKSKFVKSPSKLSSRRLNDALKVSKVLALKALACITPHAEKVFSIPCEKEVGNGLNEGFFLKERPELLSLKYSY